MTQHEFYLLLAASIIMPLGLLIYLWFEVKMLMLNKEISKEKADE